MLYTDQQRSLLSLLQNDAKRVLQCSRLLNCVVVQMPSGLFVTVEHSLPDQPFRVAHVLRSLEQVIAELSDVVAQCEQRLDHVLRSEFHWHMNTQLELTSSTKSLSLATIELRAVRRIVNAITYDWWKWVAGVTILHEMDAFFSSFVELCADIEKYTIRVNRLHRNTNILRVTPLN